MKKELEATKDSSKNSSRNEEYDWPIWLDNKGGIIEPMFADYFLELHPMRCFHGRLFTMDVMIEDEAPLKKEIYELVRDYQKSGVARKRICCYRR